MLEKLICPDKEQILVGTCLEHCRMAERCMTLPTLRLISKEREWNGVASTTQLLNGTMMEFLKLTKPYAVDPDSRAFMLSGTWHHTGLEDSARELGMAAEVALSVDRDIFDLLEVEEGQIVLTDYKLWGSYKVAKALGISVVGKKPDPSGAVYKTTSKWGKAGEPKMVSVFAQVSENADNWEAEYQLNRYRVKIAQLAPIKIDRMQLQVTVRDGGLAIAEGRGLFRNVYRIPVKAIPDNVVLDYFGSKDRSLHQALDMGSWAEPCNAMECWDGNRCAGYCDVSQFCPKGQLVNRLDQAQEERQV